MSGVVSSIFGGQSAPTQSGSQVYQPSGTSNVDSQLQSLLTQGVSATGTNSPYTTYSPQFANIFSELYGNTGAPGYAASSNVAGGQYTGAGTTASGAGGALNNAALSALPGAQSVINMGLDPNQALYNQQYQQAQDQANVANAQYGLTGQQAAGNLQQTQQNFNTSWQNNQLARAISGLNAGTSDINSIGNTLGSALSLGTGGAAATLAGGAAPYTTQQNIGTGQTSALNQYIQSLLGPTTSSQQIIGDLGSYLGQGIGASTSQAEQALKDYQQQNSDTQGLFSGIGSLLGMSNSSTNPNSTVGSSIWSGLSALGSDLIAF